MAQDNRTSRKRSSAVLSLPYRIFDGYRYHYGRKLTAGARRLVCSKKNSHACDASGTLSASDDFTYLPKHSRHNHEPDENSEYKSRFERDLYNACRYQFRDLKVIYREIAMIHQEASDLLSFEHIKFKMQWWQKSQKFPLIISSASFQSYLQEEKFAKINEHNVGRTEIMFLENRPLEHTAIIFADKALLSKVDTSQLFIQSTVKKVPEGVGAVQLTSISTHHSDYIIPVVWIIEIEKSVTNIEKMCRWLISLKRTLAPIEIYGDFDADYHNALSSVFPGATIKGTFAAHCKLMIDAADRANIRLQDSTLMLIFSKIVCVSLLPVDLMMAAFQWIISSMTVDQRHNFHELLEYYKCNWLSRIGAENYSFFNNPTCLWNNSDLIVESIANRMQDNKTLWKFIEYVLLGQSQSHFHLGNLMSRGRMNWHQYKVKNILKGTKNFKYIVKCWKSMECETPDFECFLRKTSNIVIPVLRDLKFGGVIIPAPFKLVKLSDNENVIQLQEIPIAPNDRLLAEATIIDLRGFDEENINNHIQLPVNPVDSAIVTEEVITRNNEIIREVFDVELEHDYAHSVQALDITVGANEVINHIDEEAIYNNNEEAPRENSGEIFRIENECLICREQTPTKLYRPCLHVVTCTQCNQSWHDERVAGIQEFICVKCRDLVQEVDEYFHVAREN